jgi:hypothetical protein
MADGDRLHLIAARESLDQLFSREQLLPEA